MSETTLGKMTSSQANLSHQPEESEREDKKKVEQTTPMVHSPLDRVMRENIGRSCSDVTAVSRWVASEHVPAAKSIPYLQRRFGNHYVQQVVSLARLSDESESNEVAHTMLQQSGARLARYQDPSDQAAKAQAEADRRAALQNAPVFQINNVSDRNSAEQSINLIQKVDPMLRLGAQQALNKGKTALSPGNTEKDDFEGYLKDNEAALLALQGYLGSAQTQSVALSTFQVLHLQTIAEFGRLDGKMKALLGSSLGSPEDKRPPEQMGSEDVKASAAGGDLAKEFEEAKKRDPKLAGDMKALETQRQLMETETDGLSTDANNVTNKFRGITTGLMKVSAAAAGQSSVELKGQFDEYKEKAVVV